MRFFTTFLFCSLLPLAAISQETSQEGAPVAGTQDVTPSELSPTLAPESTPPSDGGTPSTQAPASSLNLIDQDFLQIPSDPQTGSDISTTDENAPLPESSGEFIEPNDLISPMDESIPPIDPRSLAAGSEEQERKVKKRYKEVRIKAEKDPSVVSLLEKAKTATTFEGERAAYREYYRQLFRKMKKIDKSLAEKCDLMEKSYLNRLAQTRIEPTIPLEPPPKPEFLAN
jgi:hypothetical protein